MIAKTAIASNIGNALLALRNDPELRDVLAYDEMLHAPVLVKPLLKTVTANQLPRPVTDADVAAIQEFLQWNGLKRVGKDTTHSSSRKARPRMRVPSGARLSHRPEMGRQAALANVAVVLSRR